MISRRVALGALGAAAAATLAACNHDAGPTSSAGNGAYSGSIRGAGASSQVDAQDAWMNGFMDANGKATVQYDSVGSGAGRTKFLAGAVDFAGSDAAMSAAEISQAADAIELPLYISPIALAYNVPGFKGDNHIQMSGETIAKVFAGEITNWSDPALVADNPDVDLPDLDIVVVHRSDESGTTENFTAYLHAVAPTVWADAPSETWPLVGGQSGDGTSGVVQTISVACGTIGYADASKVGELGTVAVGNDGKFVPYSAAAAAATVDASELTAAATDTQLVFDIKRDVPGTYPIILISYLIAHQSYDDSKVASTVRGYLTYLASTAGQQAAAKAAGSAPISADLRRQVQAAIDTIGA